MGGCLGFHWAATYVETGLDAFNENIAREPSLPARWRPAAFRHFAVEAAGCAVRALDTSRFVNYGVRSAFGEYWRVHVNLSFVLDSGISPEFTHKWKNAIFHSHCNTTAVSDSDNFRITVYKLG